MSRVIISLSTIPSRFDYLGPVLASLVDQAAAAIWLWIPETYDRFPDWDGRIPDIPDGVTIQRCKKDLGPATKLLGALDLAGAKDRLLICDDDAIYAPDWAEGFASAAHAAPDAAIAVSTFPVARLGLPNAPADAVIVQGFAGVCLTPKMLNQRIISNRDRYVDDIWLSAVLAASGTPIIAAPHLRSLAQPLPAPDGLQDAAMDGLSRAQANKRSATALSIELGVWGGR